MINLRNESGQAESRVCRLCRGEYQTIWRYSRTCDPCVRALSAREREHVIEPSYKVPPLYAAHSLLPAVAAALEAHHLVILSGPSRTGKTCQLHHALSVASAGNRVAFVSGSRIGRLTREEMESIMPRHMVGIDDIGRRCTPASIDAVSDMLDERLAHMRKTIITTNIGRSAFAEIDERLAGRLDEGKWLTLAERKVTL